MRKCKCGYVILPTDKMIEFGRRHGRDLSNWPQKCNACIIDSTIDLFTSVEKGGLPSLSDELARPTKPVAKPECTLCTTVLGPKFYSDVPGIGDLCTVCWTQRFSKA